MKSEHVTPQIVPPQIARRTFEADALQVIEIGCDRIGLRPVRSANRIADANDTLGDVARWQLDLHAIGVTYVEATDIADDVSTTGQVSVPLADAAA